MFQKIPSTNFVDDFFSFFDEPVRATSYKGKEFDNHENKLLKLVDDVINNIEVSVEGEPSITTNGSSASVEGESMEILISYTWETESTSCEN